MKFLLTFLLFATSSVVLAQDNVEKLLQGNEDKPINIKSESLEISNTKNLATFTTNVIVIQGDMTMKADKMMVYSDYLKEKGKNKFKRIEAYGNVSMTSKGREARANKAIYDVVAERIEMYENVYLNENGNNLQGSKFIYDIKSGKTAISGGASQSSSVSTSSTEQPKDDSELLGEAFGDMGVPQTSRDGRVKVEFLPGEEMKNFNVPRPPISIKSSTEQRQKIN